MKKTENTATKPGPGDAAVRADRWLWAARLYKSRALAAAACEGGKVAVNGYPAKAHKLVRVDDRLELTLPHGRKKLTVRAVSEKRGPASDARLLYEDHSPRQDTAADFFSRPSLRSRGSGRPTKRERRETEWFRGRALQAKDESQAEDARKI